MDSISITGAKIFFEIPIFGGIPITETQVNSWIVMLAITILCLVLTHDLKVRPTSKRQIIAEWIVEKVTGLVSGNMGERFTYYAPFICAILGLSAFSSLSSLLGMYPPTADLNTIAGWAILIFCMITYTKIKTSGFLGYLKGYTEPFALFTPFNILSELGTPVSMAFRHFGNIVSGVVISTLVYAALASASTLLFGWLPGILGKIPFLQVGIPAVLSVYFDLFSSCMQAFIFSMLTMLYIANAASADE
ncbi:MAG: F0F1 ATP synthase subunit A [Clostridia bacterium]|nr:F0F1 ATP synthase subunit A [Clostridia bacterium]MBQ9716888.1 F0F1 ATP synthase subunit A [Clostridia bacterium]MBQ9995409.1 F0F1 ATP synthase subunit A [Clostridia bacterium]MBR3998294.1 F0F1 ATP synthase subunit A [Clostridia bacterium]